MLAALKTDSVTAILDSCYAGGGLRGNLVIRARPGQSALLLRGETTAKYVASETERQYQEKLLDEWQRSQQKTRQDWIKQRQTGLAKGVALLAARRNQEAADAAFSDNLHAGVFTYALTRYLWQQTRNQAMGTVLVGTTATTERLLKTLDGKSHEQTPELQERPNSSNQKKPTYFLPDFTSTQTQPAEAVVVGVSGRGRTGDKVQVLLSGVDPQALEVFGRGARLKIVDAAGREQGTIALTGKRDGLQIEGQVTLKPGATIAPGAMLQEQTRTIPADWNLKIGLDPSLGNEAAIARQELPKIHSRIAPVPLLLTTTPTLRWHPVSGATEYTVQLLGATGIIWQTQVKATQVVYAGDPVLQPGIPYTVVVHTEYSCGSYRHPAIVPGRKQCWFGVYHSATRRRASSPG